MDGLNTRPLSLLPWRYLHILFTAVLCDALVLCVNRSHWWTSKDISVLLFDAKYNIIPITEAYELVQSLLASEPFVYVTRGSPTLVDVGNPLQCSIPVASKNLRINPVWKDEIHHHPMSWYQCPRTQTLIIHLSVTNYNWYHPPWKTSLHYQYQIVNVPKWENHPRMPHKSQPYTWTGRDPPCSSQKRVLTNHFATFHTIGVRLRLDHIGFSLIWEKHHLILHHSWSPWEVQWRLAPHSKYLPEKRHFWSQYFDSANLEYTAKSTSTSLWPTGLLDNMSSGV